MYKLVAVDQSVATREVVLKNQVTKKIDSCFDDSALVSSTSNFEFMKIGQEYDCMVVLFGVARNYGLGEWLECHILDDNVKLNNVRLVKVSVDDNIYYVHRDQVPANSLNGLFMFECTRKDLYKVDDVIHQEIY